jgi:signal transduction histidine kinase
MTPRVRALVVDAAPIGEAITAALEGGRHHVAVVADEEAALIEARAGRFDVAFLGVDARDPAREVVETIRRRAPAATVALLCGHDLAASEELARHLGAELVLRKPLVPGEVRQVVARALERRPLEAPPETPRVLVVDDDALVLDSLRDCLEPAFPTVATGSPREALRLLREQPFEVLVTDLMMDELPGVELMRSARCIRPRLKAVVITGYGSKQAAIAAVRQGAYDFLEKPLTPAVLIHAARRAGAQARVELENELLVAELRASNERLEREGAERKRLELDLLQAQKLKSIGQLAAGIAHEINTPVQFIADNTRFLKDTLPTVLDILGRQRSVLEAARSGAVDGSGIEAVLAAGQEAKLDFLSSEALAAIDESLEGLGRLAGIVRALRDFSHPGSGTKVHFNLNEVVRNMVLVGRSEWKYVAKIELELDDELPLVPCLPGPLSQAILNIIVNAAHAVAEAGPQRTEAGRIRITTHANGRQVELRVADNGTGIPESIRDRIFDPYFTTKPMGKGSGQGLAIAYSAIVNQHAGAIELESTVGTGTTFIIRLPLCEQRGPA